MKRNSTIKGLILYELYSVRGNMNLMLIITLLSGLLLLIRGNSFYLFIFAGLGIALFPYTLLLGAAKLSASKWDRFQLAMPVKRKDVIASKYMAQLLILAASVILAAAFIGVAAILHENLFEITQLIFVAFFCSIGTSLAACGLFYPLACILREKNEETLATISLIIAVALNSAIVFLEIKARILQTTCGIFCIALSSVLFLVSYIFALKVYAKKDF